MMTLLLTSLLFNPHTPPECYTITEAIDYIVNDFLNEHCNLSHKEVVLYSGLPKEEIKVVLEEVRDALPLLDISYRVFDSENNQCLIREGDVGIQLPDNLWNTSNGTFKCGYQSNMKNIFGTLEFTITPKEGNPSIGIPQLFSTVIGHPLPEIEN